ncbi:MAG: AGE family epimerase/isomerase, partial [Paramuribaculum sp.]|nr:AGE family epimerase/isomerase [Paramuribaculum sp.]
MEQYLNTWRERYVADLTNDILPFWLRNGWDKVNSGVYTCLNRDGSLMDSTKSVWFQGRCGYIYAFAYNNIEPRQEYLDFSRSCIDFIEAHCFDTDGRMYFEVMADGTPLRKRRYVFSESFAAIAMSEYALATGDKRYAEKALKLFQDMRRFIDTPGILKPKYLPVQPSIGHSITMIMINTAACIRRVIEHPDLDRQIDESIEKLKLFIQPQYKALLEMVTPDGRLIDTLNGRTINPGHCIETAWFLLEEAKYRGWDKELPDMAL